MHIELEAGNNDYKSIPLNFARFARANDNGKMPAKTRRQRSLEYEPFFQAQQDFEKHSAFCGSR